MSTQAKVLVSTRLEPEMAERLEALALQDRRTTSNLLRNVVSDWLADRKATHTSKEHPRGHK
jgi:predicted DNA-binding protein